MSMEYLNGLPMLLKSFWYISLFSSLIFVIQTVLTFIGSDAGDGIEADFDSNLDATDAPFQLFSFRNLINFLLGFGWTGVSFYNSIENQSLLILLSVLIGASFVYLFFIIIKQLMKLSENNSFNIKETLNKTAEVYLSIPENKTGKGKVMLSVRGSVHELDAMTNDQEKINTGSIVKIISIDNNQLLIVEKIK